MAEVEIKFTDNSAETLSSFDVNMAAALDACGAQAESHAQSVITKEDRIDSGTMRNSISHAVSDKEAFVGTNISYGQFHEYGTGVFTPGGRTSPWSYQDGKGDWHRTRGLRPIHFIKRCVEEHIEEFRAIFTQYAKQVK